MPITDPFTVVVQVPPRQGLGGTMRELRLWLDKEKIQISVFTIQVVAQGYTLKCGFGSIEHADRFRAAFGTPKGTTSAEGQSASSEARQQRA
jgi:hypothetical protein